MKFYVVVTRRLNGSTVTRHGPFDTAQAAVEQARKLRLEYRGAYLVSIEEEQTP